MLRAVNNFLHGVLGPYHPGGIQGGRFQDSGGYWDRRYRKGHDSGSGSYGKLAEFKANFLNRFVEQHNISCVIEYGSGDGAQLRLAQYPRYTGIDISRKAVEICRADFASDFSKRFLHLDDVTGKLKADLSLSLDVIYHLIEDCVFDAYMEQLFESARRFVIIYSSNMEKGWPVRHVRHREFTRWIEQNRPDWSLQSVTKNLYPYDPKNPSRSSFADFYVFERRTH